MGPLVAHISTLATVKASTAMAVVSDRAIRWMTHRMPNRSENSPRGMEGI